MSLASAHILLVEDEQAHAELVCRSFEHEPTVRITVVSSVSGAQAVLTGDDGVPDIVVTDLRLPDGLGIELLAELPGREHPPLIVMTSQGDETAAVDAMKAGALDYIVKSESTFADMPHIVERALREWRHLNEKARLQAALIERERLAAVGTAAAMLVHEIGNPLNSMYLHAELLQRRLLRQYEAGDAIFDGFNSLVAEIRRLTELLRDFRGLSRQQTLHPRTIDMAELVSGTLSAQAPLFDDANVQVVAELASELPDIVVDRDKLTQVLVNLFKNAVEAMPDGGTLSVYADGSDVDMRIIVSDTGPGIAEDVDVFEPFKTTKYQGTGLGLAIAKQIVAAHGGSISCDNNSDSGARVTIILPLSPPQFAPT